MPVHTKLEIYNQYGEIRSYQTKTFNKLTNMKDVEAFISRKCNNCNPPFDIKILDQYHGFVTCDEDYLEEYAPFEIEKGSATTVQSTNVSEATVTLRVTLPNYGLCSVNNQQYLRKLEEAPETVATQNEQIHPIDDIISTAQSLKYLIPNDPKMGFIDGHNVNYEQRDQYICDKINVDTGEITGRLSMIQGEKNLSNKYKHVLPRFRICNDDIKNKANHVWTLLVFLGWDVYELGKHSIFYHPQRTFVENGNVTQPLNPCEIPITTDDWAGDIEIKLQLKTVVIEGAKKHSNLQLNPICILEDINESNSSGLSPNYSRSRLVLVLRKDNEIQWETLILSNEMIFKKRPGTSCITNISNATTNTASTFSKRKQSEKCHTTSNQRVKRTRTEKIVDHSLVMNSSSDNCDSSLLVNESVPLDYHNDGIMSNISQTMSTIPEIGLELDNGSIEIENFYDDSTDIINILNQYSSVSDFLNMDNMLSTDDNPLVNLADSFGINSPNL